MSQYGVSQKGSGYIMVNPIKQMSPSSTMKHYTSISPLSLAVKHNTDAILCVIVQWEMIDSLHNFHSTKTSSVFTIVWIK